jgi:hypothetical protein
MSSNLKNRVSLFAFFILAIIVVFGRFLLPRWLTFDSLSILSWDVFGYYLYLPSYFIYHDIGIHDYTWLQKILDTYHPTIGFYQAYQGPVGDYVMKYPMGIAILYAPFFFIGHMFANILGYQPDGFSLPYQVSIAMGGLVYTITGMWLFRKILLKFFSDGIAAFTMVLIVLGTNYFELTAFDGSMPHNYMFVLFAAVLWFTIRWHEEQKSRYAILLGLFIGLTIITRPTDGLCMLIPILWGIYNKESFLAKWKLIRENLLQVLYCIIALVAVVFIQLTYWKIHTGMFFYYSYEPNEKLRFIAPYIRHILFTYKKGWLIYTPIMIFPIIGFYFLAEKNRSIFYALFLFFVINMLIIASWPTWWYGGSLGQRTFMESYVFMALPLGYFLTWLAGRKLSLQVPFYTVFLFFILLNLFQTWQYMNFIIDSSRMTKEYYWAVFGRTHPDPKTRKYLEPLENQGKEELSDESGYVKKVLASYDFEKVDPGLGVYQSAEFAKSGKYSLKLNPQLQFSPGINIRFKDLTAKETVWIRATGYVYFTCLPGEAKVSLVLTCNHNNKAYKYKAIMVESENLQPNQWNKVTMDYETPFIPDKEDFLQSYFWYRGEKPVYLDDFTIELFEPKD